MRRGETAEHALSPIHRNPLLSSSIVSVMEVTHQAVPVCPVVRLSPYVSVLLGDDTEAGTVARQPLPSYRVMC